MTDLEKQLFKYVIQLSVTIDFIDKQLSLLSGVQRTTGQLYDVPARIADELFDTLQHERIVEKHYESNPDERGTKFQDDLYKLFFDCFDYSKDLEDCYQIPEEELERRLQTILMHEYYKKYEIKEIV